jgi:hypothetical protein
LELGARSSFVNFFVLSRPEVKTSRNLFFSPLSRLHVLGGAFLTPSPAPFSIVLCHPTPNSRPKEFRLVFASLAPAALLDGQPPCRRVFTFVCLFVLPRAELDSVFSASFIRSHRL